MIVLVCHAISPNHVKKGWSNIIGRSPSWQFASLTSFVAIDSDRAVMILGCHVIISQDT